MTEYKKFVILKLILDERSDPRLLGKIVSLAGVFFVTSERKKRKFFTLVLIKEEL